MPKCRGRFLYDSNLTPLPHCLTFLPMLLLGLVSPSRRCSAIMVVSLTTTLPALSSSPTMSSFGCPIHIPHLKIEKVNALSIPSIMSFALSCFRLVSHQLIGLRPSTPPHSSIFFLPRHLVSPPLTWCFMGLHPLMSTFMSLGVLLPQPLHHHSP